MLIAETLGHWFDPWALGAALVVTAVAWWRIEHEKGGE
jgi:hypothetical protein